MIKNFLDEKSRDAFADLIGAGVASVATPMIVDMYVGSPISLTGIGKNVVVYSGFFLAAKAVTDLVRPRIMQAVEREFKSASAMELDVVRLGVPFGVTLALDMLTGASPADAMKVGLGVAIASAAADYVYHQSAVKMSYSPGPVSSKK